VTRFLMGGRPRRVALRLAAVLLFASTAGAQTPAAGEAPPDPLAAAAGEAAPAAPSDFAGIVASLREASFPDKEAAVERLSALGHPSTRAVLAAFLEDRLLVRAPDHGVFIATSADETTPAADLLDPVTLQPAGSSPRESLTRIGTNNRLRRVLRGLVARFALTDRDPAVRLAAITEMRRTPDPQTTDLLEERVGREPEAAVRREMQTTLALIDLDGGDKDARLAAIQVLSHRLVPDVLNRLKALVEPNADGTFVEPDADVRAAATAAIDRIESARSVYSGAETLFFGLGLGAVLVLVAIGLAITFGVMGVINMAHGELMMLGAYTTYVVQTLMPDHVGWSIAVAIPAAFLVSGTTGIVIERTVIRFLYGRPLETLLATFGVSLVLQQAVRSIFTALNRSVATPSWMSGTLVLNDALSLTYNRLYIIGLTLVVFVLLLAVLKRTRLGLEIRAVSQNRAMARAMGIRTARVDALTFGLGSGIAGIAGVALSQLTNVGPNLGQAYIIDSFMVVVFGGVGNLWGALIGGTTMGILNNLLEPMIGAVRAKILVLVALILFIQRRPRGLFPPTGRAAEQN
jgi:urea transport system permease protein